jgi:hypothetical protein
MKSWLLNIIIIAGVFTLPSCASEERVVHRIDKKKLEVKEKFRSFKVSCDQYQDFTSFYSHEKTYYINAPFEDVWNGYTNLQPKEMWAGPLNKFKEAYSKSEGNGYIVKEDKVPVPAVGTVYELKLKIIQFLKIPVNFEVTQISKENKVIEFTYGANNKSKGKQTLTFVPMDNYTLVLHQSYFKSGSKMRDQRLYPKFHEKCLNEFHNNIVSHIKLVNL